jgi:hypothetical protein
VGKLAEEHSCGLEPPRGGCPERNGDHRARAKIGQRDGFGAVTPKGA